MDIAELAVLIRDLIFDNDEVSLPGVGVFVTEEMPAAIVDKGYTINPPYRKLAFRQKLGSDTLLLDAYVQTREDKDVAREELFTYLQDLKTLLKVRKTVSLPGLGRLRATRENIFFFIPDEDMDIYPEGFGLSPVSMKMSRVEDPQVSEMSAEPAPVVKEIMVEQVPADAAPEAVPAAMTEPQGIVSPEPAAEQPTVERPIAVQPITERPSAVRRKPLVIHVPKAVKVIFFIVLAAAVLLAVFALLGRLAPDFVDKFLYSPEERAILNY